MATYTENFLLKKPSDTDFFNIEDFNNNADTIDDELIKRAEIPSSFTSGNITAFDASGNLLDTGKKASDFMSADATYTSLGAEKSGEAVKVQNNLTSHENSTSLHLSDEINQKISKMLTTDNIVISSVQPALIDGTVWIKIE